MDRNYKLRLAECEPTDFNKQLRIALDNKQSFEVIKPLLKQGANLFKMTSISYVSGSLNDEELPVFCILFIRANTALFHSLLKSEYADDIKKHVIKNMDIVIDILIGYKRHDLLHAVIDYYNKWEGNAEKRFAAYHLAFEKALTHGDTLSLSMLAKQIYTEENALELIKQLFKNSFSKGNLAISMQALVNGLNALDSVSNTAFKVIKDKFSAVLQASLVNDKRYVENIAKLLIVFYQKNPKEKVLLNDLLNQALQLLRNKNIKESELLIALVEAKCTVLFFPERNSLAEVCNKLAEFKATDCKARGNYTALDYLYILYKENNSALQAIMLSEIEHADVKNIPENILHVTIEHEFQPGFFTQIAQKMPSSLLAKNADGLMPLQAAFKGEYLPAIYGILQAMSDAHILLNDGNQDDSPLMLACQMKDINNRFAVLQYLMWADADVARIKNVPGLDDASKALAKLCDYILKRNKGGKYQPKLFGFVLFNIDSDLIKLGFTKDEKIKAAQAFQSILKHSEPPKSEAITALIKDHPALMQGDLGKIAIKIANHYPKEFKEFIDVYNNKHRSRLGF
jgi:hypothetical protein